MELRWSVMYSEMFSTVRPLCIYSCCLLIFALIDGCGPFDFKIFFDILRNKYFVFPYNLDLKNSWTNLSARSFIKFFFSAKNPCCWLLEQPFRIRTHITIMRFRRDSRAPRWRVRELCPEIALKVSRGKTWQGRPTVWRTVGGRRRGKEWKERWSRHHNPESLSTRSWQELRNVHGSISLMSVRARARVCVAPRYLDNMLITLATGGILRSLRSVLWIL